MALVNTAAALALRGRRVLVVDFDLEAPGLDSFNVLKSSRQVPGIIDFVNKYLKTGKVPKVENYVGECPDIGEQGGRVMLMPSGSSKAYATKFNQIDWDSLYRRHDGYLLFEDLKLQWERVIEPDYVLIDSRTGYTDVSGICTRQLPNAVVALFFPNDQNLRGLINVVKDIRNEKKHSRSKSINLHFVMSNVPDLDDEDQILAGKISKFRNRLKLPQKPMIIHHYSSLSLLNQAVFVIDRPNSRLAKEYSDLVQEIVVCNYEDRDGALEYIHRQTERLWKWDDDLLMKQDKIINRIEGKHSTDSLILYRLAKLRETLGDSDAAALLVNQAIEVGNESPEAYLTRSKYREKINDVDGAIQDVWRVLISKNVSPRLLKEAISRLIRQDAFEPEKVADSASISSLTPSAALWLIQFFNRNDEELIFISLLLNKHIEVERLSQDQIYESRDVLGMVYMCLGKFDDAAKMFRREDEAIRSLSIAYAFDYGMALWGSSGVQKEIFEHVVDLDDREGHATETPNYFQCLAIAYGLVGDRPKAIEYVQRAKQQMHESNYLEEFSCWRYRQVSMQEFIDDLDELNAQLKGQKALMPDFVKRANLVQSESANPKD